MLCHAERRATSTCRTCTGAGAETEVKAEVNAEVNAEVKAEVNAEVNAEVKAEVKAEVNAEVKAEGNAALGHGEECYCLDHCSRRVSLLGAAGGYSGPWRAWSPCTCKCRWGG